MDSVFKFAVLRPPEAIEPDGANCVDLTGSESELRRDLKQAARSTNAHADVARVAETYRKSASYVDDPGALTTPLHDLLLRITSDQKPAIDSVKQAVNEVAGRDVAGLVQDAQFQTDRRRLEDSLLATLVSQPNGADVDELAASVRLCGLLHRIAADDPTLNVRGAIHGALKETVLLPDEVFPLPPARPKAGISKARWKEIEHEAAVASEAAGAADGPRLRRALDDLVANSNAEFRAPPPAPQRIVIAGATGDESGVAERRPELPEPPNDEALVAGWILSERSINNLAPETINTVKNLGIDLTTTPLIEVVEIVEASIAKVVSLPVMLPGKVLALGGTFFDFEAFKGGADKALAPYAQVSTNAMSYRALGVMDLHVVKTTLQRYELGEVAHVENVLLGESKVRTHRLLSRAEET